MNGRVYDPTLARFLSPDPYVQAPDYTQGFNRYSYCYNNPFKYTDPTGEFIGLAAALLGYGLYSGLSYVKTAQNNGWDWNPMHWGTTGFAVGTSVGMNGNATCFAGVTFDGNNFANVGRNYNGYAVGCTVDGVTTMENVNLNRIKKLAEAEDFSIQSNGTISQYKPNAWERFRDKNIFSRIVYKSLDDAYVYATNALPGGSRHLAGGSANANELRDAGVMTVASIGGALMGGELAQLKNLKYVNAVEVSVAEGGANVVEEVAVHGNSLKSLKPTWGYKLYSQDGTFLKNGITNKLIPETRYTKSFMFDKYMDFKFQFPNRAAAYEWEFQQNLIQRGPLNLNMH